MKKSALIMGVVLSVIILAASAPAGASQSAVPFSSEVMTRIVKNIQDSEALLETAQGYLNQYRDVLCKIRELMVRGANGIYDEGDRWDLIKQVNECIGECERILEHAQFNGLKVFNNPETGESFHVYPVTLSPSETTFKITISSGKFNAAVLKKFTDSLKPTPLSMENGIAKVDELLTAVCMEAAKLGAYQSRMEYAARFANILANGGPAGSLDNYFIKLNLDIDTRLFTLAVQSASGIYCADDRKQIQMEFNELFDELKRYEKITGMKSMFNDLKNPTLLTQKDAEELMILMAGKFAESKKN
ncbi:MAG: hypothetical protein A2014_07690 [Spirochaetes bacterium GWF1_49_6]|nr:MAG: hypothetical protein A2014_07690 [Spirochaetes bacterium GWF1_49_6]